MKQYRIVQKGELFDVQRKSFFGWGSVFHPMTPMPRTLDQAEKWVSRVANLDKWQVVKEYTFK